VTNYPPTADEGYIRELFKDCGEIFSIRWPSLKFNTHRRFCYISFRLADAAAAATQLDGKMLEGRYKLEAKYSDPGNKKPRESAINEGRELHVANLDFKATEDEVREVFSKYGSVESVRILRNIGGKSRGSGFVVFEKKEDATEALVLDKSKFMTQILKVELSAAKNFKPTATSSGLKASSASPAPDSEGDVRMSPSPAPGPSKAEISSRTIALMNVPDTVNDARIRVLSEPYGDIVKLVLRPDHQGAIIEFGDVGAAGRAALGLENHEIVPGRRLRTGGVKDLFQEKDEVRSDRIQIGAGGKKAAPAAFIQPSAPVRRPGGRGGLGVKRGLGFGAGKASAQSAQSNAHPMGDNTNGTAKEGSKSNDDFKAMINGRGQT